MRKVCVLFALLVLVGTVATAEVRVGGAQMLEVGGWPQESTITDPGGENQVTLADGSEVCCDFEGTCTASGGPYAAGTSITLNTYWTEEMPTNIPTGDWIVLWTLGLRLPNGNIVVLFQDEPVNFGPLKDIFESGDLVRFCVAGILELPPQCTGGAGLTQGHGVADSPSGASLPANQSDPLTTDDDFTCI